jgi:WD40 repeat protein
VDSVAFSPDGKLLATGDADGNSIYLWHVIGEH